MTRKPDCPTQHVAHAILERMESGHLTIDEVYDEAIVNLLSARSLRRQSQGAHGRAGSVSGL